MTNKSSNGSVNEQLLLSFFVRDAADEDGNADLLSLLALDRIGGVFALRTVGVAWLLLFGVFDLFPCRAKDSEEGHFLGGGPTIAV